MMTDDPFWVLESNKAGWRVVYCFGNRPQGGVHNGNWIVLADGMKRNEAVAFAKRLRKGS